MFEIGILSLSVVTNLGIGLIAYNKNRRSASNWLFALLCTCLVIWPVVNYFSVHAHTNQLLYIRLVLMLVVLMNSAYFCLAVTFPRSRFRPTRMQIGALIYSLIIAVAVMTPLVFKSLVILADGSPSPVPAPGVGLFVLDLIYFVGFGSWLLWRRYRTSQGREKAQLSFLLAGAMTMYSLSIITNFILAVAFHLPQLVILGPLYTVIFASAIAYAIVRHRLFDVRKVIARSISYTIVLGLIGLMYSGAILALGALFYRRVQTDQGQLLINSGITIALALTFQPLRRFFERLTDRVFYRDRYDSQEVLNVIGKTLAEEIILEKLLRGTLQQICSNLRVEVGQFMIFNKGGIYKVEHYGPLPKKIMVAPTMLKLRQSILVADELEGGERKQILDEHGVRLSLMLHTHDEFVGFLFLGDKLSGDIYSNQDLQLLRILAQELSIAFVNAKAYEEIQEFNRTLQDRVGQATARLRVANHNLKALDKAKDEFISMASHQLRTPLTTIKGYLSMILEGDAGPVSNQQVEFVNYAYSGAERMVSLISDLLNVSRLSAGRFVIEQKPTDLVSVVQDEVRQLQNHAIAKHLELVFTPPKRKLPLIDLDEGKTRQVIMNFIDNGIYYTRQGGVYLTLEADLKTISLLVRDTGIGVPEVAKKKLFSKFFRAENAQAARPDGTGLGLFLAKRVIEDQGGTIIFESTEGKGSTFGFTMPIRTALKPKGQSLKPKVKSSRPPTRDLKRVRL